MEFFFEFLFQPILRAVRKFVWPLADRYHLLTHLKPQIITRLVFFSFPFFFFLHFYIFRYNDTCIVSYFQPFNQFDVSVDWHRFTTRRFRCSYRDSSSTWNVNPVTRRSSRIKRTSLTRGLAVERRRGGEQTNKGKTKNARKESFSVSRSRGSRVFLTRVTRPLSTFQIRNTLGAQGFPISPSFIARVSGYHHHHHYGIRRETQRGRGCNPATETARLRALETFHADASSALENRGQIHDGKNEN